MQTLYYLLTVFTLGTALLALTRRDLVNSAMFSIQVFLGIAGFFLLLDATYLAIVQVLVYAGAIVVLFLFVIMLLHPGRDQLKPVTLGGAIAALVAFVGVSLAVLRASSTRFPLELVDTSDREGSTLSVVRLLFSRHVVAFEATALILLVAMIGVVVLSRRDSV